MDPQIKKGILDACVLTCLRREDSYGYKIIMDLRPYIEISESTLYPILKRLESMRCLVTYTNAHSGRMRKYYSITPAGHQKIREFAQDMKELINIYKFIDGNFSTI